MKHLVVPVDFSEISERGIELAYSFAPLLNAGIKLVNVVRPEHLSLFSKAENNHDKITQLFEELISKYKAKYPKINLSYKIREGKVHRQIKLEAEELKDSFIVTSTHGASGWEELFIGSNAYKIIAASTKPVITVRENFIPKKIKRIILPIDNTPETREKVPVTAIFARFLGADVHVVAISKFTDKEMHKKLLGHGAQVCTYLDKYKIDNDITTFTGNDRIDKLLEYSQKVEGDLISVMTGQESGISNFLLGNLAHQVINNTTIPVMLFPTKQIGAITDYFQTISY